MIGCRWVLKTKRNGQGEITKYKGRLVAQGFSQTPDIDFNDVFAPVVKYSSLRGLLAIANHFDYEIHNELYMKQPEGYVDNKKSK